jgi:hypothetical protein
MNLDLVIDIASKLTFSTHSNIKALDAFSQLQTFFLSPSKLKRLRFSAFDSLCLNEAKLLCLVLITFVYNFQFN